MEKEEWNGVMGLSMKENGNMDSLRAKEHFIIQMAMCIKESGSIVNVTDMGFISTRKELGMKDNGKMIHSGEEELKHGLKEVDMKACMPQEKNKAMVNINGPMDQLMLVNGQITRLMAQDSIIGQMVGNTGVIGEKMICMEQEFISTLMELDMKDSFKMIKKQVMDYIIGKMVANMKGIGTKVNNMDQVFLEMLEKVKLNMAFGNTEIVLFGSMKNKLI